MGGTCLDFGGCDVGAYIIWYEAVTRASGYQKATSWWAYNAKYADT